MSFWKYKCKDVLGFFVALETRGITAGVRNRAQLGHFNNHHSQLFLPCALRSGLTDRLQVRFLPTNQF